MPKPAQAQYLQEMYTDSYYPPFLVDKINAEILKVVRFLKKGTHRFGEVQAKFDAMTLAINALQEEFEENGSEIETLARESIGQAVQQIIDSFGLELDTEMAIRQRDW